MAHMILGLIIIAVGMSILIGGLAFKILLALLFIALGVKILMGKNHYSCYHRCHRGHEKTVTIAVDRLNETAVFCALNRMVKSERFDGGSVTTVFGGGTIDLSGVTAASASIVIDCTLVFGGMKLIVPPSWNVKCQGTSAFGGCDNHAEEGEGVVVLTLTGTTVFGGIEIVR